MADDINGALKELGRKLDDLSAKTGETNDTLIAVVERLSNHIERPDIHSVPPCGPLREMRSDLKKAFWWLLGTSVIVVVNLIRLFLPKGE